MKKGYLSFLQSRGSAILEDFGRDLVAGVLEVHDRVRDLEADGNDDGLDVEGPQQAIGQNLEMI